MTKSNMELAFEAFEKLQIDVDLFEAGEEDFEVDTLVFPLTDDEDVEEFVFVEEVAAQSKGGVIAKFSLDLGLVPVNVTEEQTLLLINELNQGNPIATFVMDSESKSISLAYSLYLVGNMNKFGAQAIHKVVEMFRSYWDIYTPLMIKFVNGKLTKERFLEQIESE